MQVLAAQREAYANVLLQDAKNLKAAIQEIEDFDDVLGLLNFMATVATDIALDVVGFGALTGSTPSQTD